MPSETPDSSEALARIALSQSIIRQACCIGERRYGSPKEAGLMVQKDSSMGKFT
jgi:hypothetical protein